MAARFDSEKALTGRKDFDGLRDFIHGDRSEDTSGIHYRSERPSSFVKSPVLRIIQAIWSGSQESACGK